MARTLQVESINSSLTGLDLTTAGVSRLFITNSGNVGINTITASTLFEVNGDVTISDKIIHAGDTNTFIRFVTSDTVSIDTAGSERMRITSNGGIAFGGAANYGTSAHVLKSAGDSAPVWGFITNANVDSAAAIAYTKLSLGTSIVNTDISASAAIAYSKLNLTTSIANGDIASGAAIAVSKLAASTISGITLGNNLATLTFGTYLTGTSYNGSTAATIATNATNANTASAIVARDASGNFSAGTITASLTGTATTATTATTANALNTANNYQVNSIGVGTGASGTAGEIRATNNITAYYSDERLKNFIGKISNALEKVNSLNGYYYKENSKAKELGYNNDSVQVGISAQEVEKILPEIVTLAPIDCATDSTGETISKTGQNYKTVYYEKLIPLLIEAIKELSSEIEKLKHK